MNKKGFTLVELIAVIVVIGIVALIAVTSLTGVRNKVDIEIVKSDLSMIINSAKSYGENITTSLPYTVQVNDLVSEGLEVPDEYKNLKILIYIENRRVAACINQIASKNDLINIMTEDNYDKFTNYYCIKLGDIDNDGEIGNKDYQLYQSYVNGSLKVSITKANSDLNGDNIYNGQDLKRLYDIVNGKSLKKE